jgi:hypothetical protein
VIARWKMSSTTTSSRLDSRVPIRRIIGRRYAFGATGKRRGRTFAELPKPSDSAAITRQGDHGAPREGLRCLALAPGLALIEGGGETSTVSSAPSAIAQNAWRATTDAKGLAYSIRAEARPGEAPASVRYLDPQNPARAGLFAGRGALLNTSGWF